MKRSKKAVAGDRKKNTVQIDASTGEINSTSYDEMFFNIALEAGLLTRFAKRDYGQRWRVVGFILKDTFDDEKGLKLFEKNS